MRKVTVVDTHAAAARTHARDSALQGASVASDRLNDAAVQVDGLTHEYQSGAGSVLALDGVDLAVAEGEFVALVGPSGCGKSTLLRVLAGLIEPSGGTALVHGGRPQEARGELAVGLVTQDPGLLPWRTVAANVALPLEVTGATGDVDALLRLVGIDGFAGYHPRELSGGMRQRVALARALAHAPRLLLMDEPFGSLDEFSREEMGLELVRIWERERISVLFVTHSIREAVMVADRVLVMSAAPGRIVADVAVTMERPRSQELEHTPEFGELVAVVRSEMAGRS
ncbi:MAG: ABC transporter ATP-binding protein [Dehalococcoidia bacterium]|jgi:NitT/TauT family transport system ATP-binding protein|nr:ABC transporter ATP-binding protein [Dehalococcoidia bacterium]